MDFKEFITQNNELQKYLFVRGFLLTNNNNLDLTIFPFFGNWNKTKIGKYSAYTHYLQKCSTVEFNNKNFFLFGHAYNPFTMEYEEDKILQKIAENYGTDAYYDLINEMTGIFVFGVIDNDSVEYLVDPAGIQSACYGEIDNKFYLSSHPQLVGDLCNLKMDSFVKELTEYKWYYRVMGPYLPADLTPFKEVKRIVPNIQYFYKNNTVEHKRFYPIKNIQECKTADEYQAVINKGAEILKNNMYLVAKKWNKPYISLTGGIDSNTTFASANGIYDKFKTFSYISAEKEIRDAEAAKKISEAFNVPHIEFHIPENNDEVNNFDEIVEIIEHNNGYIAKGKDNEYRKRIYLLENLDADVEVKSWVSETIRAYWYKHYGRKNMPALSPKLFRNLYKIFIFNRSLAHKIDKVFAKYIKDFEYDKIPDQYPIADMHFNEVTWGSWGGLNISEMKIYSDITIIYNNRKFLDIMFKVPLAKRIDDTHHLDMKKVLNKKLYDMNIRIVNMKETDFRAFMLNILFTINSILPY